MTDYAKLNRELSEKAEEAREVARLAACKALAVARKCRKGKEEDAPEPIPEVKAEASQLGKEAWEARKLAKAASAEAATARRIACFRAMPAKAVPEVTKGPLKPPPSKRAWEE